MLNAQQAIKREEKKKGKDSLSLPSPPKKRNENEKRRIFTIMHNRHYLSFATILSTCLACQRPIHISFLFFFLSLFCYVSNMCEKKNIKKIREKNKKEKKNKKDFFRS